MRAPVDSDIKQFHLKTELFRIGMKTKPKVPSLQLTTAKSNMYF